MEYKFQVEFMIDEKRVIEDGVFDLENMYQVIVDAFQKIGIPRLDTGNPKMLSFATEDHDKYAEMWMTILDIEESIIMPYLSHYVWYNNETGAVEDVLEECKKEMEIQNRGNEFIFVSRISIDTDALPDGENLDDVRQYIIGIFKEHGIPKLKGRSRSILRFGTKDKYTFGKFMDSIHCVCLSKVNSCLKEVVWHNFETDSDEDVLAVFRNKCRV